MKFLLNVFALLATAYAHDACADIITLDAVDRGWYGNDGGAIPGGTNYLVGNASGFVFRNWFVFDLSAIDQTIVSAELHLWNFVYVSNDPTETYALFDVSTSPSVLMNGTGGIPAFNDLGSGSIYGSYLASSADDDSFIDITLNSTSLISLNETAGNWAVGGAITTLDNNIGSVEHLFTATELVPLNFSQLIITTIPAPAALPLLLASVLFNFRKRNRRRS